MHWPDCMRERDQPFDPSARNVRTSPFCIPGREKPTPQARTVSRGTSQVAPNHLLTPHLGRPAEVPTGDDALRLLHRPGRAEVTK